MSLWCMNLVIFLYTGYLWTLKTVESHLRNTHLIKCRLVSRCLTLWNTHVKKFRNCDLKMRNFGLLMTLNFRTLGEQQAGRLSLTSPHLPKGGSSKRTHVSWILPARKDQLEVWLLTILHFNFVSFNWLCMYRGAKNVLPLPGLSYKLAWPKTD